RRLPPGGARLRRRLTPLAAGCCALGPRSYHLYCPSALGLASFASGARGTRGHPGWTQGVQRALQTGADSRRFSRDANAWVEERVDHVDEEVDDDVAGGGDEHDTLDRRVVACGNRVDREMAEAGDDEDHLGDHHARDERAELQADHGRDGDQAVA